MRPSIAWEASEADKAQAYQELREELRVVLEDESDWVAGMATAVCELHHRFSYFHWTGFYRVVAPELLVIGPYQGGHGCLRIPFSRGVCGACATRRETILVDDVHAFAGHIACSTTTQSEIVVPVIAPNSNLLAVFDVDSDRPAAFSHVDRFGLERIMEDLGERYGHVSS